MAQAKRKRGRPVGSGNNADHAVMAAVAQSLAANPSMKPTAAMKIAVPEWNQSILRRLQRKWKADGGVVFKQAKAARAVKAKEVALNRVAAVARRPLATIDAMSGSAANIAAIAKLHPYLVQPSIVRQFREMQNSGVFATAREAQKHMLALRAAVPDLGQWSRQIAEHQKAMQAFMPHTAKAFAEAARAHENAVRLISGARF